MELKYQHLDFLVHNLSLPSLSISCAPMPSQQHCETQLLEVCAGLSQVPTPLEQEIGMSSMLLNQFYSMFFSFNTVQFSYVRWAGPIGVTKLQDCGTNWG